MTYEQLIAVQRQRLAYLTERFAPSQLSSIFTDAQDELVKRLRRASRLGKADTLTAYQQRVLLAQTRDLIRDLELAMGKRLEQVTRTVQEASLDALISDMGKMSQRYAQREVALPIAQAAWYRRIIEARQPAIQAGQREGLQSLSQVLYDRAQQRVAVGISIGENPMETIDGVQQTMGGEWWRAERMVRTDSSAAYNAVHQDGILAASRAIPTLKQRWTEFCTNTNPPAPLDSRVAPDSIAMHGQVSAPGGVFVMPPGSPGVSPKMWGKSWSCPPQRPNDRAVLVPWQPDWGIPGWEWQGRKVWLER